MNDQVEIDDEILRFPMLVRLFPVSRTTLWRLSRDPESGFPRPLRLSTRTIGWKKSEILAFLASRRGR